MKRPNILLVDDEAIVRDSVSEWLKNDSFNVECACDGNEALEKINHNKFDTAVVDLKMPGMDGLEVTRRVKQIAPQTTVIIITAYGTVENAVEAMKIGASDYLTKPFTLEKLEKAIENSFSQSQSSGTVEAPAPVLPTSRPAPTQVEPMPPEKVEEKPKAKTEKQCIWSKAGVVAYRVCANNFKCDACEFAQTVMDKGTEAGDQPMMAEVIRKMLEKPGPERVCRYMLSGHVTHRLCSNVYRCGQCAFNEAMEEKLDAETAKMTAKVKSMQERKTKKGIAAN